MAVSMVSIPRNVADSLHNSNWIIATQVKMDALVCNDNWEFVILLQGEKSVGYKWVFNVKYQTDDTIDRYKAVWWPRALLSQGRTLVRLFLLSPS